MKTPRRGVRIRRRNLSDAYEEEHRERRENPSTESFGRVREMRGTCSRDGKRRRNLSDA